jgi:MFS family permease
MGFGIINFLFAIPAIWTIDSFGRRNLLLSTFPFMALFQIIMVVAFALPGQSSAQHVLVILGMYLFGVAYSAGEGPVPFVYSAESMPLYNRDFGMGIVTSVNWFWNFFISITWPKFSAAFGYSGAFGWYAAWCVLGFFMILFLVPETKDMTLEELDQVFEHHTMDYVNYGMKELKWLVGRWLLMRKGMKKPPPFLQRKDPEEIYDTRGEAFDPRGVIYEEMQEDKHATTVN